MAADDELELEFEEAKFDAVEFTGEITATDENYTYLSKARSTTTVGEIFSVYGTLTSSDAIDFYPFTLTEDKSVVFAFDSGNEYYVANLGLLDTSDGTVTLSSVWLYPGDSLWASSLGSGDYCWVILSVSNTYTTDQYHLCMNASNKSGATSIISATSDLSYVSFLYSDGTKLVNNEDIQTMADDIVYNISGFKDKYETGSPSYLVATVGVVTSRNYVSGTVYYGSYTSTNTHINPYTNMAHSSDNVLFIPIIGHTVGVSISSNYIPYSYESYDAYGYLIYDLESEQVIDFMSSLNILYSDYFTYTYSYSIYATLSTYTAS